MKEIKFLFILTKLGASNYYKLVISFITLKFKNHVPIFVLILIMIVAKLAYKVKKILKWIRILMILMVLSERAIV